MKANEKSCPIITKGSLKSNDTTLLLRYFVTSLLQKLKFYPLLLHF